MKRADVAILGAGPAGLFAAYALLDSGLQVALVDRGGEPSSREHISYGVGGAGAFSDGKLNLTPDIGGDPASIGRGDAEVQAYIDRVDAVFTQFGAPEKYSGEDAEALAELGGLAARHGIEFIRGRQRHMGTAHVRSIIDRFYHHLVDGGIEGVLDCRVTELQRHGERFLLCGNEDIDARFVIAAPGRAGAYWFREEATKLGIATEYGPIDVGVRVEFPAEIYAPIERVMYDAKFRVRTATYDDMVRTFCTNPRGFVVREAYEEFSLVNGHAENDSKTSNTNVALLSHIGLTNPVEDTTEYGRAIATLATTIGGGRPLLQRLKDLQAGRRSTAQRLRRATIAPTLEDATPGDISMALPSRVTVNLIEGLEKLDKIMPGLVSDNTLLYAPEIKFYDTRYPVSPSMETPLTGLFVTGDASGHCRGIVYSALTGLIAGEAIRDRVGV
jgi:uncharacterized FAD-dependent dehydrogenase